MLLLVKNPLSNFTRIPPTFPSSKTMSTLYVLTSLPIQYIHYFYSNQSHRETLLKSWQYLASPDSSSYAHWESITATSNELKDTEGDSATLIIVGQIIMEKLAVDPLRNFQSQEEKQLRYQDSDTKSYQGRDSSNCLNAKLVVIIRRPTAPGWRANYNAATSRLDHLQEDVAKGSAPCQYLLDKEHKPPFVRLSFPLWEKKVKVVRIILI